MQASLVIGHTALSAAFIIYWVYFIPQLWHNRKLSHVKQLSWALHTLYSLCMCLDWVYGWGYHLAWQYRVVTGIGLIWLCVQHIQLRPRYNPDKWPQYWLLSASLGSMLLLSLWAAHAQLASLTPWLSLIGFGSSLFCWSSFLPQMWSNYRNKWGESLNVLFVWTTILTAVLDFIAAICLGWPWPSIVGPPVLISIHLACLFQQQYYKYKQLNVWLAS